MTAPDPEVVGEERVPSLDELSTKIKPIAFEPEPDPPTAEPISDFERARLDPLRRRRHRSVADASTTLPPVPPTSSAASASTSIVIPIPESVASHINRDWYTPLSKTERENVLGTELIDDTMVSGSPTVTFTADSVSINMTEPNRGDIVVMNDGTSITKMTTVYATIAHNLQMVRARDPKKEFLAGTPVDAILGCVTDSCKYDSNLDYARYLFAAYTGSIFAENEHKPQFVPESPEKYTAVKIQKKTNGDSVSTTSENSGAPITRPNGEIYHPRRIPVTSSDVDKRGMYDVHFVRLARENGMSVLAFGDPGTGKTALFEAAFSDIITLSGNSDIEASDFFGSYVPDGDNGFVWRDGPLLTAAKEGRPFVIEEINLIDSRVLALVYPAMDGRGEVEVTINPTIGTVKVADGFYVVATCNPDAPGSIMSDAMMSRFAIHLEVTTDYELMRILGVPNSIVTAAQNLDTKRQNGEVMRSPQARELIAYRNINSVFGQRAALANLISQAHPGDRDEYSRVLKTTFGQQSVTSLRV
jgi:hypothetical protein